MSNDQIEITGEALTAPANYFVTLGSVGNPDKGQDPDRTLHGTKNASKLVGDLAAASAACSKYIRENQLGAGNWSGGDVYVEGRIVARISYNGRVWAVPPVGDAK